MENTEYGPADTGLPLSIPVWNPAGAPLRTWLGSRLVNSSRHAG